MSCIQNSSRTYGAALLLLLTSAVLLTGCDDDSDASAGEASSSSSAAPAEDPASSSPQPDPEPAPETEPATVPESDDPALTGEECLPGNWFLDNVEFGELMSGTSGGAVDDVKGSVMVTFREDGTTTTHYDEWSHTISVDSATVTIVRNGADRGTYEVSAEGSISLTDTDMSSTTTSRMEIAGRQVTQSVAPEPSVFSQAAFTCQGDELTVRAGGAATTMYREH